MTDKTQQQAATALTAEQQTEVNRQIEAARAEGKTEGIKAGADGERGRIKAILTHAEAKERPGLAMNLALESDMSVELAAKTLTAAAKESSTGKSFMQMMAGLTNPAVGADADDAARQSAARSMIDINGIYEARRPKRAQQTH